MRATQVGFAGGHVADPTYRQVCEKDTGHAEVVLVEYDTRVLSTQALLREFFALHNFEINRGKGTGQYRSCILAFADDEQLATARRMLATLQAHGFAPATDVDRVDAFYRAEARHQQYCSARGLTPTRRDDAWVREVLRGE